jgi:hypothetical protein
VFGNHRLMIGKNMANTLQLSLKDISQWAFETLHFNSIEEVCTRTLINYKIYFLIGTL